MRWQHTAHSSCIHQGVGFVGADLFRSQQTSTHQSLVDGIRQLDSDSHFTHVPLPFVTISTTESPCCHRDEPLALSCHLPYPSPQKAQAHALCLFRWQFRADSMILSL